MHYLTNCTLHTDTFLNEILCRHDVVVKCMDNLSLLSFQIHTLLLLLLLVIKFCFQLLPASSICF